MTVPIGEGFPKAARIRRRREFLSLGRTARRSSTPHLVVLAEHGSHAARLGITVSRKVGSAVVRNRVKRQIREAFRRAPDRAHWRGAAIVIAKVGAACATSEEVRNELVPALGRQLVETPRRR